MRCLVAVVLSLAFVAASAAQAPAPRSGPTYAVVSMVGDRLEIVNRTPRVGSHIERNDRTWLDLDDTSLNDALGDALYDALEPRVPMAHVVLLTVRDPASWKLQNRLLAQGASTQQLVDSMKPFLDRMPAVATHMVLATKMRADALFEVDRSHVGTGKAEGLGFYVDRHMSLARDGYVEPVHGFLAAFAYFRLSLVDLRTRQVVREIPIAASVSRTAQDSGADHPWDTMSALEKVEALKKLLHDEAGRAVATLLAG